jgi:hypothetical protein
VIVFWSSSATVREYLARALFRSGRGFGEAEPPPPLDGGFEFFETQKLSPKRSMRPRRKSTASIDQLKVAGITQSLFDDTRQALYQATKGILRKVNKPALTAPRQAASRKASAVEEAGLAQQAIYSTTPAPRAQSRRDQLFTRIRCTISAFSRTSSLNLGNIPT